MATSSREGITALRRLALLRGVQTSYVDILHGRRTPPAETLLAVLRCLGDPLETVRDAPEGLRRAEEAAWDRFCPPVCVSLGHGPAALELRVPCRDGNDRVRARILLESGETEEADFDLSRVPASGAGNGSAGARVAKRIPLPWKTPYGYHRLEVELRGMRGEAAFLSAPARAWSPPEGKRRDWGVFLPLYALHSRRSPGGGDLTGLRELMDWVRSMGGDSVATLPLLSANSPEPFDPSPYSPCSRLAWNEFYLDPERAPGFDGCAAARKILSSEAYRREEERMRRSGLVDYPARTAMRRPVFEALAERFFRAGHGDGEAYRRFLSENPSMEDYAAFRAAWDGRGTPWPTWPSPMKDGRLGRGDFKESARRYHLFVQYALHLQLRELSPDSRKLLYLDLPLGTSYDGYDVWRRRKLFALDASAGAPPDDFFTKGQDWGFPPPHPERWREEGHAYFRECLANQLRYADTLRIDHVMGLHRFFWVPKGFSPMEGTYVRYPAEELYAVLCLESIRNRARLVGEDLGTVPPYVRPAMARHGVRRIYVAQFGLSPEPDRPFGSIPGSSVACMNTHDMPTFASFWNRLDVDERVSLGFLDPKTAAREKSRRAKTTGALSRFLRESGKLPRRAGLPGEGEALQAALACLAESPAETVIVSLEDLWRERMPHNVPGTWKERPNWRRKSRFPFEEFRKLPEVLDAMAELRRIRGRERQR